MFERLKNLADSLKRELVVYQRVMRHPRTPWPAKALLGVAIGYALLPFDLIPDFIPILGLLDDVVVIPVVLWLAIKLVPQEVVEQCRQR